jgi:putative transposase
VKLTIGLKLTPNAAQAQALEKTLRLANAAANECSRIAWESKTFGQFQLHKLAYKEIRQQFGLSAQVAVRAIAKVADAYKLDKETMRVFRLDGSIAFDDRILRYGPDYVSIWTTAGRQKIGFVTGEKQKKLLESRQGESDLVFRDGKWFLFATVNVIEPPTNDDPDGFLGVDLGIARIATDSDGQSFSGAHVRNLRKRHRRLRGKLQSKQTKSAKRRLRDRRRKEQRYASDLNHQISKKIVDKAKRTNRAIVLENLSGIRSRVRVQKARRAEMGSWSFGQLRTYIEYKAALAGVKVITIDARNTSRECSLCGHIEKLNRRSQKSFQCRHCDHKSNADVNAARVIASRGAFNRPNAGASATRNLHL